MIIVLSSSWWDAKRAPSSFVVIREGDFPGADYIVQQNRLDTPVLLTNLSRQLEPFARLSKPSRRMESEWQNFAALTWLCRQYSTNNLETRFYKTKGKNTSGVTRTPGLPRVKGASSPPRPRLLRNKLVENLYIIFLFYLQKIYFEESCGTYTYR